MRSFLSILLLAIISSVLANAQAAVTDPLGMLGLEFGDDVRTVIGHLDLMDYTILSVDSGASVREGYVMIRAQSTSRDGRTLFAGLNFQEPYGLRSIFVGVRMEQSKGLAESRECLAALTGKHGAPKHERIKRGFVETLGAWPHEYDWKHGEGPGQFGYTTRLYATDAAWTGTFAYGVHVTDLGR